MTSRTLNYGNYGIFLILGNAGFISSTVGLKGFPQWDFPIFACTSEMKVVCLGVFRESLVLVRIFVGFSFRVSWCAG